MSPQKIRSPAPLATALLLLNSCKTSGPDGDSPASTAIAAAQVPSWNADDMQFFLHGSMSAECVPEPVLQAFIAIYPDVFPTHDFSHLGMIPDQKFGWPIGISRGRPAHLGGLPSVGVNCAACHVAEILPADGGRPIRVLGATSDFDAEAFFGTLMLACFRTADPVNMRKFLASYLLVTDPATGQSGLQKFVEQWDEQQLNIVAAMAANPSGNAGLAPGDLNIISAADLRLDAQLLTHGADLADLAVSFLKLFHNMRAALHVPDQAPTELPPRSGPGRNDAFGLLSAALFGHVQTHAPSKYGLVWNLENRRWVHWDANTRAPIARNLIAALGLGAPMVGHHGELDFALVQRQTDLSEKIRPPRCPFAIDRDLAARGAAHYQSQCAICHDGPETDSRLYSPSQIGTQPLRAQLHDQAQADRFNQFFAKLEIPGYQAPMEPWVRATGKYWAPSLAGVWARAPYLHNGSVRTIQELLLPADQRPKSWHRGSQVYDPLEMGYRDEGDYLLDTTANPGNSDAGHEYGSELTADQKRELIEYLKTL